MKVNKRILRSTLIISVAALALVASGSSAFFSDTETSTNNILQAGAIDLKIDNHSYYNGEPYSGTTWELADLTGQLFFDFHDLKPGDWGEDTISAHINNNPAWLCMNVDVTSTPENGVNEPESKVDKTTGDNEGELQNNLKFVWWADDGDNVLETDENIIANNVPLSEIGTVALADSDNNIWSNEANNPLEGGNENEPVYYVGKAWCFGDLTLAPVPQGNENDPTIDSGVRCDGKNAGNESQTDGVIADVSFTAIQARHNDSYKCEGCQNQESGYASYVVSYTPGLRKDGSAVPAPRNNADNALGSPDGSFVSLGFGGEVVLQLPGYITGNNITTFEITFGREGYPDETAEVYVSEDGVTWHDAGQAYNQDTDGKSIIAVSGLGLSHIEYVKLVDTSNKDNFSQSDADGYDLDSIEAVICLDEQRVAE